MKRKVILWIVGLILAVLLVSAFLCWHAEVTSVRIPNFKERQQSLRNLSSEERAKLFSNATVHPLQFEQQSNATLSQTVEKSSNTPSQGMPRPAQQP